MKLRISGDLSLPLDFITSTQAILAKKRVGKCVAPETMVIRFDGATVRADSINVGDLLMGPDSRPRRVLHRASGRGPMFEIIPIKGDPWRCNDAHVLTLMHTSTGEVIDIPLDDYLSRPKTFRHLHMQFMAGVEFGPDESLPLSPYFLGLWFGDGDKTVYAPGSGDYRDRGGSVHGLVRVGITTMDSQVVDECTKVALRFGLQLRRDESRSHGQAHGYRIVNAPGSGNGLLDLMRVIVGTDVVVPHRYLTANRVDRLAFLAGWIDSDGHLQHSGFDFIQKRRDWIDAVAFLARSLGFRAAISQKLVNGEVYWRTQIRGDIAEVPTRLPHKIAGPKVQAFRRGTPVKVDHRRTGIKRVVSLGVGDYAGFTLDGDGRFLLGDFTVTHNSYTAQVLAEELLAAGQQVVVIDPTSAWWGLRSSADGKSAGYPITIFGGRHGDLPLEATSGEVLANAIVADKFSAVLDVRLLKKGQRLRFIADFLEALYDKNTEAMHLFLDECDAYCPQRTFTPEQARALGATDELVRRGGIGGIGVTMISQRAQTLNKDVLSQVDMLTVLRMNHPKDLGAIRDWVVEHVDAAKAKEMMASLPSLPKGAAWVWAPELGLFKRITVRPKRTYDSGRTPKVGERIKAPKVLAKVDLERLGATIKETVERAKENDPKQLKAEVARLRKANDELAANAEHASRMQLGKDAIKAREPKLPRVVEKPILKDAQIKQLERAIDKGQKLALRLVQIGDKTTDFYKKAAELSAVGSTKIETALSELRNALALAGTKAPLALEVAARRPLPPALTKPSVTEVAVKNSKGDQDDGAGTSKAEQRILSSLAWWESIDVDAPSNESVAFVAGYTVNGHFTNMRGRLSTAGLIEYPGSGLLRLTEEGRRMAPSPTRPRTLAALHSAVFDRLDSSKRKILAVLIDAYPKSLSTVVAAEQSGYTVNGHFTNMRGRLSTLGLITYPRAGEIRASDILFPEALS